MALPVGISVADFVLGTIERLDALDAARTWVETNVPAGNPARQPALDALAAERTLVVNHALATLAPEQS